MFKILQSTRTEASRAKQEKFTTKTIADLEAIESE